MDPRHFKLVLLIFGLLSNLVKADGSNENAKNIAENIKSDYKKGYFYENLDDLKKARAKLALKPDKCGSNSGQSDSWIVGIYTSNSESDDWIRENELETGQKEKKAGMRSRYLFLSRYKRQSASGKNVNEAMNILKIIQSEDPTEHNICMGVIVDRRWVLSSTTCALRVDLFKSYVTPISGKEKGIRSKHVIVSLNLRHNLAMFEIHVPLKFDKNSGFGLVCLPVADKKYNGQLTFSAFIGEKDPGVKSRYMLLSRITGSKKVQNVEVSLGGGNCKNSIGDMMIFDANEYICPNSRISSSGCFKGIGSPGTNNGIVVAIMDSSDESDCINGKNLLLYTVSTHVEWIENTVASKIIDVDGLNFVRNTPTVIETVGICGEKMMPLERSTMKSGLDFKGIPPWVVSIYSFQLPNANEGKSPNDVYKLICSGSIVAKRWVLGSASCVKFIKKYRAWVVPGGAKDLMQKYRIASIQVGGNLAMFEIFPPFELADVEQDLRFKMSRGVKSSMSSEDKWKIKLNKIEKHDLMVDGRILEIKRVCLPFFKDKFTGTLTMTGLGEAKGQGLKIAEKVSQNVKIGKLTECPKGKNFEPGEMLCEKGSSGDKLGTKCFKGLGAPLTGIFPGEKIAVLAGVTDGKGECLKDRHFINVVPYLEWISQVISGEYFVRVKEMHKWKKSGMWDDILKKENDQIIATFIAQNPVGNKLIKEKAKEYKEIQTKLKNEMKVVEWVKNSDVAKQIASDIRQEREEEMKKSRQEERILKEYAQQLLSNHEKMERRRKAKEERLKKKKEKEIQKKMQQEYKKQQIEMQKQMKGEFRKHKKLKMIKMILAKEHKKIKGGGGVGKEKKKKKRNHYT